MTTETTLALTPADTARALFEALSKRDVDAVLTLDSDDAVGDVVAIGEFRGKAAIRRFLDEMFTAFPDLDLVVDGVVGDDARAVVQWHATGSFTGGTFQGIEPTGRRVEMRGIDVVDVVAGRIVRDTMYYDGTSLARQIGMLPRSGSGPETALLSVFNRVTRLRAGLRHATRVRGASNDR